MYTVVLTVSLWKDSERKQHGMSFFRKLELPFAPFVELGIETSQFTSRGITQVVWRPEEQCFFCSVEDQTTSGSNEYDDLFKFLEEEERWIPANKWKKGS